MNTYWVYENIKKQWSFYNKLDVLLLLCSTVLWKRHHPTHTTFLFCDELTFKLLTDLNAVGLWDNIELISENPNINKEVFWAASKVSQLKTIKKPTILLDHDLLVYKPLEKYFKELPLFAHEENGERYYPTQYDDNIKKVSDIIGRPKPHAINCSFLYFPDPEFANLYASKSLEIMERFTEYKVPNSKYLIFAEQLTLKALLDSEGITYNTLIKESWNCKDLIFEPKEEGIFSYEESLKYFRHYWMDKSKIKNSKDGFVFEEEIHILYNILTPFKDLNLNYLNDIK